LSTLATDLATSEPAPPAAPVKRRLHPGSPATQRALAAVILIALGALAWHFNTKPRHEAFEAVPDVIRVVVGAVVLFGLAGFGLVRLLLPAPLRRFELLWVLPAGACAAGLALTVLGFAGVPYAASLAAVLAGGLALGAHAVRRRGWPQVQWRGLGWPLLLAFVVLVVALVPLLFVQHFDTPIGNGSDAHEAVGAAQFLKHSYPTSVNVHQPLNQMPPTWQSKFPIYYAFAGVSTISGLATWQVLAPLEAALAALAALGMLLIAREVFAAPRAVALAAMGLAGLDRMALYTVQHPYFNQTWGYLTLPFTLVLGWIAVQPSLPRRSRQATLALLVIFAAVLVLAYPLAAPIPAVPLLVFWLGERRRRIRAGEQLWTLRGAYRSRRSLLWMIPLAAALAVPIAGAVDKAVAAAEVLAPGHTLQGWAGDLMGFIPVNYFFSLPASTAGTVLLACVAALAAWGLARQPRALAAGLGALLAIGFALAVYLRGRLGGQYFQFKLLAFIGPLVLVIAAVGAGRLRRAGALALAALAGFTAWSIVQRIEHEGYQLGPPTVALSSWARSLPPGASVRLDVPPAQQLWVAYFMDARPLCSQLPLLGTDYPHVAYSRKADYILTTASLPRPRDAIGPAVRESSAYRLYREKAAVPGPSLCTLRRFDRIYSGAGHSRY
jgi:hypothetical protein